MESLIEKVSTFLIFSLLLVHEYNVIHDKGHIMVVVAKYLLTKLKALNEQLNGSWKQRPAIKDGTNIYLGRRNI